MPVEKDDSPGALIKGDSSFRLNRLRTLLTGTTMPTEEAWDEGLGRLLVHLAKYPMGVPVLAELSEQTIRDIEALALARGVDGNTIVTQAINTLKLLTENMGPDDELLIRKMDGTFKKVTFA